MKKTMAILMSFLMVFSVSAFGTLAAQDQELTQAILKTKDLLPIPSTLTEFTYSVSEMNAEKVWQLNWRDKDWNNSASASITGDGRLFSYSFMKESNYKDYEGIASLTKDEGLERAKAFLTNIMPEISDTLRLEDSSLNYSGFYYLFNQYVNDLKVLNNKLSVTVDKNTGEIISYSGHYDLGRDYPAADKAISLDDAKKAYLQEIGAELVYRSSYDYQEQKLTVFPTYVVNSKNSAIDALTGEVVELTATPSLLKETSGGGARAQNDAAAGLSPKELAAVEGIKNLLTKDTAADAVRNVTGLFQGFALSSANLYADRINKDTYIWSLTFVKETEDGDLSGSASVDARTGELLSLYNNSDKQLLSALTEEKPSEAKVSPEAAKAAAEAFLKKVAADKFALVKEDANPSGKYSLTCVRYVNGIPFRDNYLTVNVSSSTGDVVSFHSSWYKDAQFPSIGSAKTDTEVFETIAETLGYGMYYYSGSEKNLLVYDFNNESYALFDPFNAARISGDGKPYREDKAPVYTDIAEHWCRDAAIKLAENNIYFDRSEVKPDQAVTQRDFLYILYKGMSRFSPETDEALYEDLIREGILTAGEKSPASLITRADAVKFIIRAMHFDEPARLKGIYVNPFADDISDDMLGYVALAYGFKIVKGDHEGNFNAEHDVTNAETLTMLYNMLTR